MRVAILFRSVYKIIGDSEEIVGLFSKFINSSLNYQVYEPKDQPEILMRLAEYSKPGLPHAPGFRYAINIDSAMLQVAARRNT